MRRCWLHLLACLLFAAQPGSVGADSALPSSRVALADYFQEVLTSTDGLPHNLVIDIEQTGEGYLWVATWEGVVRYNGRRFDIFDEQRIPGLPDRGTTELARDAQGRLLVGTARGGMARRDADGWKVISTDLGRGAPSIYTLQPRGDTVLVGTAGNGLLVLDGDDRIEQPVALLPLHRAVVYSLAVGPDGAVWIGTDSGLYRWQDEALEHVGVAAGMPETSVLSLLALPEGDVIVGADAGAWRLHDGRAALLHSALDGLSIESLMRDHHGDIWVGSAANGLFRIGERGLEHLDTGSGLPSDRVASFAEDREGNVWVGTSAGLFRLHQAPFRAYTEADGLSSDYARTLYEDADGALWIGGSRGIDRIATDGTVRRVATHGWPADQSVLSLAPARDGGLWVGTYYDGLLYRAPDGQLRHFGREAGLPSMQVRGLGEADDGTLWIGTSRGLLRWRGEERQVFTAEQGLPSASILSLYAEPGGRIWAGTSLGLAIAERGDAWFSAVSDPAFASVQRIYGFNRDNAGDLWVSSDRGVLRLREGRWQRVGAEHGLPVAGVFSINQDAAGDYWLSSNRGVIHVGGDSMRAVLAGRAAALHSELFTEADGMASAQCNGAAGIPALKRRDGSLWFATARGVARIEPDQLEHFQRPIPAVELEDVIVDGQSYGSIARIELPPGMQRIELTFVGLSFQAPRRIHYRYRLDGFDPDWIDSGDERSAQYTNLPVGDYLFHGSAANPNGEWAEHEALLEVSVLPFWWQRRWVQGIGLLVLVAAVWSGTQLRVRNLRRSELRLKQEVAQATDSLNRQAEGLRERNLELDAFAHTVAHDLKNPLTTILGLSRVLDLAPEKLPPAMVATSIQRIHATSGRMAEIIDALLLFSQSRGDVPIACGTLDQVRIVGDVLTQLNEMVQLRQAAVEVGELPDSWGYRPWIEQVWTNYVSNAIKYGGEAPAIEIGARQGERGRIRYFVRDHGPGLDGESRRKLFQPFSRIASIGGQGHGLGLSIVRRLVERMGGQVGCDSEPGEGSVFWFELPQDDPDANPA